MSDYPLPDWTRAQIEAWEEAKREARLMPLARAVDDVILHGAPQPARPLAVADRPVAERRRMCSSCGSTEGHRRGDKACPNYATPWRWMGERKVWKP